MKVFWAHPHLSAAQDIILIHSSESVLPFVFVNVQRCHASLQINCTHHTRNFQFLCKLYDTSHNTAAFFSTRLTLQVLLSKTNELCLLSLFFISGLHCKHCPSIHFLRKTTLFVKQIKAWKLQAMRYLYLNYIAIQNFCENVLLER